MINAKVKIFDTNYTSYLEDEINGFLETIDIRQVIKTEYSNSGGRDRSSYSVIIYYLEMADVRDVKLDNVLEIK